MTIYSPFTSWFDRCVGSWNSDRRYLYCNDRGSITQRIQTRFVTTATGENKYDVAWSSDVVTPTGEIMA